MKISSRPKIVPNKKEDVNVFVDANFINRMTISMSTEYAHRWQIIFAATGTINTGNFCDGTTD